MRKRLLFTLFAILFCSTTFGQKPNWEAPNSGAFQGNMTVSAYFKIYGEEQFNQNIEFAAFCGNELRGVGSKPVEVTLDGEKHYLSVMTVHGNANDIIKFKIWDPVLEEVLGTLEEKNFYLNDVVGPIAMDFYQEYWDFTRDVNEIPQSMTIISQIAIDDNVVIRPNLEVAAFHGDELRGIGRYDEIDNNMIYFTIYGNNEETENITFKLYDHNDGTLITESDYSKPFKVDDVLGDYFNPEIINFITASYVAQIGENKYTTFEKAYEAAQNNDNIILLDNIDFGTTTTVISKAINITLGEYAITGTVELANTGATITGAENGVTEVITNVADYKVVYDGSMYKLVAKVYVAKVGDVKYETIQEAVSEASVDATIVIIGNASDETVTVDKNLTITGSNVTLNNVAFNANGANELTVSGLSFTGNSWINSGTAEKLTVSGVTADVTPSNASYTNSRSAFISLGSSEQQQLELYVTNCNIVANGGADPILGWAAITKADIIGNTFGSESAYQTNSDCVKFMAIAQGAVFNITGNTIYSNYNGIVFGQNTTRDNAYTVNVDGNTFKGNANHIWIEVRGSNTTHATVKATSNNTVNGNEFTANDIKLHPNLNTFTSYAGVDVVLDVNGKVLGGTFKYVADGVIADGYEKAENNDGTYGIIKSISGKISYRAYVNDTETREGLGVDLENIVAKESVVVKLYDANDNPLTTTSLKAGGAEAATLTCNIVLWGDPSSSWETDINVEKFTVDNYPKKAELLIDGTCIHTFDNILGNATDAAAYQLPAYLALDCVYKAASITKDNVTDYYMTFAAAYEAAQSGDEIVLHDDVLLTTKQTIAKEITINGNNHSIKADETAVWYTTGNPPLNLKQYKTHLLGLNSDNITLKNIVLDCNDNAAGINLYCAQNVTFDNVEIINATKGYAALTVNGSTLTVKTKLVALGNPVAIDIDLGSGVTSALGFDVEDNTVFDLGGKQVKYNPAATIDMDGAVDTNGNPYFAAKDNANYYTVAQMESRTTAYNGLTLLTDVAINSDIRFSGNTLDLNEKTLSISAEKQMEVSGEFKITNGGAINGKIVLTTQETTITTTLNELNVIKKEGLDGEVVYVEGKYMLAPYVAKINDVYYISLQAAYEAVQPTGVIVLLQNITLSETMTIAAEKNFTLDLNGKTINVGYQENSEDKHIYAFDNKGTLTITNGTVNARGIFNYGTLTVNADATVNSIDANGGYGVDNKGILNVYGTIATTTEDGDAPEAGTDATPINNEANATVNVYEGSVINNVSNFTSALRNSGTANIKGGTFTSVHTTVINHGTMTIDGGSFTCDGLEGITAHALWAAAGTTTINGGTFDGKDNYNGSNVDASEGATVYITGGNFLPVHSGSLYGEGTIAVSGGKFFDPVPEGRCAEGYIPTTNADGTYGVKPGSYVAQVGEVKYETLEAAYDAAQANDEIVLLQNITLTETLTIEKAITLNLKENTVTGADGAIVFNVKAATTIKNGTVLGNKSDTSSGLIDIYADINLDGVTIETTKIRALAFKESVSGTPSTATLTNCNVTGGFKGYGGSVWEIKSGVYKASSTSITDQLNGTASVSGGTFHYEIDETDCAPGYVVKNNGNGTWTVEYAPAAFVDTDKDGVYNEDVDVLYGNLDQIFADYRTGDVYVVLTKEVVVANNKVDTDVDAHFYITTNVEGGTTMDFLYADPEDVQPYNCVQNMDIAENVTLNVKYFTIYGNFNLKGTVNAFYPFIIAANVNIAEDALFNQNVEGVNSEAIQIKDGAVVTVEGKVEAKYINLYKSDSYTGEQGACLRVTGANAEVNVSSVDLWKGETLLIVENGAKFKANSIKASRGGSIEVDGATIDAAIRLGHDTTDETTLTASGTCTLGQITLATLGSKVVGPEGFEVVSGVNGYGVNYYDEVYSLVQIVTQSQTLSAGWNWFSSYIDINGTTGLAKLQNALGTNGIQIKGNNTFTNYIGDEEYPWYGTLTSTSVKEMYMIKVKDNHSLQMTGELVAPAQNAITLVHGWNWIGYQLNTELSVSVAIKEPKDGDRIKSHQGFSQYYKNESYTGWWGTLETMTPGYGYMYYNANEDDATLEYSYPADGSKSEVRANITSENNYWVPASSRYAGNMNIVAMLEADGDNYEIAAFVGGEVRGSARPIYVEPLDAYMFFLTVHGEDVEEMTFRVYDLATGEEYNLNDRMNYTDNAIVGSITEPYIFRGTVGIGETSLSEINVYPNPTTTGNEINLGTVCDTVEVFNALGVKVAEYQNVDTVDALETAGVYVIRITNDGNVQNCRLIVK